MARRRGGGDRRRPPPRLVAKKRRAAKRAKAGRDARGEPLGKPSQGGAGHGHEQHHVVHRRRRWLVAQRRGCGCPFFIVLFIATSAAVAGLIA
ncbi:MAG: hypothetical protein P8R54_16975 [Myxococcota bacterium]|nr:hypothetical protein [Myxococcota bacterium]